MIKNAFFFVLINIIDKMVVLNQIIPFKSKPLWGTFNALAFVGYEKATPTGYLLEKQSGSIASCQTLDWLSRECRQPSPPPRCG